MGKEVPSVKELMALAKQLTPQKAAVGIPAKRHIELPNLEQDIAEMRREAWANFPREEFYF